MAVSCRRENSRSSMVAGRDFNIMKDITLTSGSTYPPSIAMEEFNGCLESIDVVELSSHGCLYTWGPRLMAHPSYEASFSQAWGLVDMEGSVLDRLFRRLKRVKQELGKFNQGSLSEENLVLESNQRSDLARLSRAELEFLKSRARITWLEQGDFDTRFLNMSVLAYRNKQQISMIMGADGVTCIEPKGIEDVILGFYKGLFTSSGALSECKRQMIRGSISKRIPRGACDLLVAQPSLQEVKEAFHGMPMGKCPGLTD
ncbi:hypothetical protein LIER_40042 [Lithospermum erythrorhizon]|uniref:Uncharacterized protein n=1 Tax=Lithospermum erythrorhizon TaxID=34254 RepID=A0AAV3QRU3_LITER